MQLTRTRAGVSRKALAAGIATALLIGGIGSISAEAATKKPAAKVTKKPAATKPAATSSVAPANYTPNCGTAKATLKIASAVILENPGGIADQYHADEFMKICPNVKVEFIGIPSNLLDTKLTTMAIGGNLPDLYMHFASFTGKALQMRIFDDLRPILGEALYNDIDPMFLKEAVHNGQLIYAPWVGIPTAVLYRTDLWEKAGNPPFPKTWAEFLATAKKLTVDTDKDGKVDQYGWAIVGTPNNSGQGRFMQVATNSGAFNIEQKADGSYVSGASLKGYEDALQLYQDAVKQEVVPPGYTTTGYPEASAQLATGKAVMMITGPHSMGIIVTANKDLKGKLAGFTMPTANGAKPITTLGAHGYAIARSGKQKALAGEYLKFQLSAKVSMKYNEVEYRLPSRLSVQKDPVVSSGMAKGFVAALAGELWITPPFAAYGSVQKIDYEAYSEAFQGKKTAKQIAAEADAKIKQLIKDNA